MIHREQDIIQWGIDRNLYNGSDALRQFGKMKEEAEELLSGLQSDDHDEIKDGIGDIIVCLVHVARFHGMTVEECIEHSYQEIKDRRGTIIDGKFVKESA